MINNVSLPSSSFFRSYTVFTSKSSCLSFDCVIFSARTFLASQKQSTDSVLKVSKAKAGKKRKTRKEKTQAQEAPEKSNFICCITQEEMKDPVVAADGHSYERDAIQAWLKDHKTSPLTGEELNHKGRTTYHTLRKEIEDSKKTLNS